MAYVVLAATLNSRLTNNSWWPNGKALLSGGKDCGFESRLGRFIFRFCLLVTNLEYVFYYGFLLSEEGPSFAKSSSNDLLF